MAMGLLVGLLWIIRRIAQPRKLFLRDTPGRPNVLGPLHLAAIVLVWFGLPSLAQWALTGPLAGDELKRTVLLSLVTGLALLGACLVTARLAFRHGIRQGLGLNLRHAMYDTLRGVVTVLAAFPPVMGLALLLTVFVPEDKLTHEMLKAATVLPTLWVGIVILVAVVIAPLAEEAMFRGILQSAIRRYTHRPWVAVAVAGVLFGLVHFPQPHAVPAMILFGVILGYNYERCGRLYPCILAHAAFNAINMTISLTAPAP